MNHANKRFNADHEFDISFVVVEAVKSYEKIVIILVGVISVCMVGRDSLYVEIDNNTVTLQNINVWENCAFYPEFTIDRRDSIIVINEED